MKKSGLLVPAIKGSIGSWNFYLSMLTWDVAVQYISIAEEIVQNKELSKMIQRQIKSNREGEVANYILSQSERFFGSLVSAVYKGDPKWHQLGGMREELYNIGIPRIELSEESFGFLELTGEERIFALDGQHRLVGIRKALRENADLGSENISVIFVGHNDSKRGLERTRRLFTTLNKKAVPVKKGEVIALDEDDVTAICTRRLVETEKDFSENRVVYVATNRMPTGNDISFTTIGALYDVIGLIVKDINRNTGYGLPYDVKEITLNRPDDLVLDKYFGLVKKFFSLLKKYYPEFKEYCASNEHGKIAKQQRNIDGGHILFRPQGLLIITKVIAKLTEIYTLEKSIRLTARCPIKYESDEYEMLIWNPNTSTIVKSRELLVRDLLLYSLGHYPDSKTKQLLARYKKVFVDAIELPKILH